MMAGKDWLVTDVNRLRALYAAGASMDEIANAFPDRTRKAVQEKAYAAGYTSIDNRRCRFSDAQDKVILAELRRCRDASYRCRPSWVAVSKKIGVERAKVQARAYRLIEKGWV